MPSLVSSWELTTDLAVIWKTQLLDGVPNVAKEPEVNTSLWGKKKTILEQGGRKSTFDGT